MRCCALIVLTTSALTAQPDWSISTTTGPGARFGHAMAYDGFRDVVVLFGGISSAGSQQNDTWEFDGTSWTQITTATSPPGRDGHTMAFNIGTGKVFLFGGDGGAVNLNDTWEYDGIDWVQLTPNTVPQARKSHAIAYDLFRGRITMFGGNDGGALGDTWIWDDVAQDWIELFPTNAPSPRLASAMDYSLPFGDIVLYSGYQMPADTWLFDGVNWRQVFPANNPGPRYDHTLTTDDYRQRVLLFGSLTGVSDTWEWDGSDWVRRTPANLPSARIDQDVVFDAVRERMVLLGGGGLANPETWVYENPNLAQFELLGTGCAGSNGIPSIAAGTALPWIGETFPLSATNLPAGPCSMLFGFRSAMLDLGPVGMPGCELLISTLPPLPLFSFPLGTTSIDLTLGNDPVLIGLDFYYQAFCADSGANAFGAVTSNSGHGTVGAE